MVHRYLGGILLVGILLISVVVLLQDTTMTGYVVQDIPSGTIPLSLTILNSPPSIVADHPQYFNASDNINISRDISDPNGNPMVISWSSPVQSGGEWNTTIDDWGYYNITINATDNESARTSKNLTLVVHGFPISIEAIGINIRLNWTAITGATSYVIYAGSHPDNLSLYASSITSTDWTDTNRTSVRFYRVAAIINEIELKSRILGAYQIALDADWNLISLPLDLTSYELGEESVVGNPIVVEPANSIMRIHRYNVTTDSFEMTEHIDDWGWVPATGSESFTALEKGRGYWFETNESGIMTIVGSYPMDNLTINLDSAYNIVGWYSLTSKRLGKESTYGNPLPVVPANSISLIHRYRTEYNAFEALTHFAGWGWWPYARSESFQYLEPGRGYYFYTTGAATWQHEP